VPFWYSGQMASLSATAPSPGTTLGVVVYGYTGVAGFTFNTENTSSNYTNVLRSRSSPPPG